MKDRRWTILVLVTASLFTPENLIQAQDYTFIHVVDQGIKPVGRPTVIDPAHWLFQNGATGQIPILMPERITDGKYRSLSDAEWISFEAELTEKMEGQILRAKARGVHEFEIRMIQAINLGGYLDWSGAQQLEVQKFGLMVLKALNTVRSLLERNGTVDVDAWAGSNGAFVAAKILPILAESGDNPVDMVTFIDGRAKKSDVEKVITALKGRVAIVVTEGDWLPSTPLSIGDCYIASLDCAKRIKNEHDKINVFYVDPVGKTPIDFNTHVWTMTGDARLGEIDEYANGQLKRQGTMSQKSFRDLISAGLTKRSNDQVSKTIVSGDDDHEKRSRAVVGSHPPPPGPLPCPPFCPPPPGTGVRLLPQSPPGGRGGGERKLGGIKIAPLPVKDGTADSNLRDQILRSRPAADSLSFPTIEPQKDQRQ